MAKVAKLVLVSLMTRVVVDENLDNDAVALIAKEQLQYQLDNELLDNVEEIFEDEEMPYDPALDLD